MLIEISSVVNVSLGNGATVQYSINASQNVGTDQLRPPSAQEISDVFTRVHNAVKGLANTQG